ncbi:MAG: methylenetetrahydrofolate reductase [Nitriliruptorales bacterium]|nr:methylenetetrahydrofolate reductase [Nitriliruptorales bacterium]
MTRIADLLARGRTFSFEFFPPKTDDGDRALRDALNELEPLEPSFVSITYGAGGSTRERTHRLVVDLLRNTSMTPMAHLTAYAHSRDELRTILVRYRDAGVENILALRGDPPRDDPDAPPGDLEFALELVEMARDVGGEQFAVGVAAHPECHPLSPDRTEDRKHLAAKLLAADFGITQFFFRAHDYLRMVDELAELGCDRPVIPGIMPITNVSQIERFAALSGAAVPSELAARLHAVENDPAKVRRIGVEHATALCQELLDAGAPGLHFYTLNRSRATRTIYAELGLGPQPNP